MVYILIKLRSWIIECSKLVKLKSQSDNLIGNNGLKTGTIRQRGPVCICDRNN